MLLLNRTAAPASIALRWADLGLLDSAPVKAKDIWAGKDLATAGSTYSAESSRPKPRFRPRGASSSGWAIDTPMNRPRLFDAAPRRKSLAPAD